MKLYQIDSPTRRQFAGAMKDARTTRQQLMDDGAHPKKDVTLQEVEVPTKKPGLIAFLNAQCDSLTPGD